MNRKKIETNKIIEIVRVTEPEIYEELFFLDNGQFTPVKILVGAFFRNGRVSNFWDFENLTCQELCDLMCGEPEADDDRDCEICKHYKKVDGKDYMACSKWDCKFEPKTS